MSSVMLMVSDCPLQDVPYPPDFTITFDADNGTVDDGGMDDGFAIYRTERVLELPSQKRYFAILEWRYTPGRAKRIIEYLKGRMEISDEIELWHVWQDMDFDHKVRKVNIPINELSTEDLLELYQLAVWKEPVTDYCYVLTRA